MIDNLSSQNLQARMSQAGFPVFVSGKKSYRIDPVTKVIWSSRQTNQEKVVWYDNFYTIVEEKDAESRANWVLSLQPDELEVKHYGG